MIADKKEFYSGLGMMAGFFLILIFIFLPLFNGKNGIDFLDNLFNSISKQSAYYIPGLKKDVAGPLEGKTIAVTLELANETQARESVPLFTMVGATAVATGATLRVEGDMGKILGNCLEDSDALFYNRADVLKAKYGIDGKTVLYDWWLCLKAMNKTLNAQKQFKLAKADYTVMTKAVECAYNYYKVVPLKMADCWGVAAFALIFYVCYTLWYGFAILFLFEGWGLKISH